MKKILLCVLAALCYKSFSQAYHPMLGDSNTWYVSGKLIFHGVSNSDKRTPNGIGVPCLGRYDAIEDSTFNGKTYKRFTFNYIDGQCTPFDERMLNFLVREDTATRKIYIIPKGLTVERIAMDFGMNIGDTIYLAFPAGNAQLTAGYYQMDSIVTKTELVGPRKHFYLRKYGVASNALEWIESIGAAHVPFNLMQDHNSSSDGIKPIPGISTACKNLIYSTFVTCKYTNGSKWFQDSCTYKFVTTNPNTVNYYYNSCHFYRYDFFSGLGENSLSGHVYLYPNPGYSIVNLRLERGKGILTIYNSVGQKVLEKPIDQGDNEIILDGIQPGMYSVIVDLKEERFAAKFIRE